MTSPDPITIDTQASRIKRMRSSILTRARLISHTLPRIYKPAMLTLTYRDDHQWTPKHISALLTHIRNYLARRMLKAPYVWVAELTQRGRIHYHVLLWLPKGLTLPKPDKRGWWPHGSTRIEWARHAVAYLAKYASKGSPHLTFPKGCRLHGVGAISDAVRKAARWWTLPSYLRAACFPSDDVIRRVGGGFIARATGVLFQSAYGLVAAGIGRVRVIQIRDFPPGRDHRPLSDPAWGCALAGLDSATIEAIASC